MTKRGYLYSVCCALGILLNAVCGGEAKQTLCTRGALAQRSGKRWGCVLCQIAERLDPGHCSRSLASWLKRTS